MSLLPTTPALPRRATRRALLAAMPMLLASMMLMPSSPIPPVGDRFAAASRATPLSLFKTGTYTGPAGKGVVASRAFDRSTGVASGHILEFEADDRWSSIEGPSWTLTPHAGQAQRLELSVPLWPRSGGSLKSCAGGRYDVHYRQLARNLKLYRLGGSTIRPGWELNTPWMRWSSLSHPKLYAACFRRFVSAMRSAGGIGLRFDWCVGVNQNVRSAIAAWPGRSYVDYVGVDAYDISWSYTSSATPAQLDRIRRQAVSYRFTGLGGIHYWAQFAKARGVRVAVPEWGLSVRADGHGGGDDEYFVAAMANALQGRSGIAEALSYAQYFNVIGATGDHRMIGTRNFPRSRRLYVATMRSMLRTEKARSVKDRRRDR